MERVQRYKGTEGYRHKGFKQKLPLLFPYPKTLFLSPQRMCLPNGFLIAIDIAIDIDIEIEIEVAIDIDIDIEIEIEIFLSLQD